ncbi:MAG: SigB/SigF/SigG family RNA polymerase sigma factor [Wujia sp.]
MGSKAAKEKIVSDNTGLVWSIARRFTNRGYDLEELYQIGCIGLLKAVDRFESRFGVQFSTYAVPLISGEIKRFLRDNGAIKVSRILKQNGYHISLAKEQLLHKLGREATIRELSEYTGFSVEDIVMATEANREVESIQQPVAGGDGTEVSLMDRLVDEAESEAAAENVMNKILIGQAMKRLSEEEQQLIRLRFFEDKTQMEVAKTLGISQVQVSRLEKKILLRMRNSICFPESN